MRNIILTILAIAISTTAYAENTKEPISFKGIALGQPGSNDVVLALCMEKESNRGVGIQNSCNRKHYKKNHWGFSVDYGSLVDTHASFEFDDNDAIHEVQIREVPKASIPDLVAVMESKYGKPTKAVASVENKIGMKFENTVYTWSDSRGNLITVESIHKTVDQGRVLIQSAAKVETQKQLQEITKEVGKANL